MKFRILTPGISFFLRLRHRCFYVSDSRKIVRKRKTFRKKKKTKSETKVDMNANAAELENRKKEMKVDRS